jgi:biopolymer transport protein ExbD
MTWKVRHEGSPRAVEGLTPQEVVQGLQDGQWEATDEVMGPQDTHWLAIESHPLFADAALDLEPPPAKTYDDETRLDFTPLIDVCLVLLIFFILTTSYAALQKMFELPDINTEKDRGPPKVTKEQVEQFMIQVTVRMEKPPDGGPKVAVIDVEDERVPRENLVAAFKRYVNDTRKTELLIDHDFWVPEDVIVAIEDAARLAGVQRANTVVPKEELGK